MPLATLLNSATGTCRHCRRKAGVVARTHRECQVAFDAARTHDFDEKTLRLALAGIARRSCGNGTTVNEALEEGWKQREQ